MAPALVAQPGAWPTLDWSADMGERRCCVEDCERPCHAQGRCATHYQQQRATGELGIVQPASAGRRVPIRSCDVDGCELPTGTPGTARGLCSAHYMRWKRWGSPLASAPKETDWERFLRQVDQNGPNGCWLWTGTTNPAGYGRFWLDGKRVYPHRFAYEMSVGPIADGLQIDHLCRTPRCCNPQHLEAVTPQINSMRSRRWAAIR